MRFILMRARRRIGGRGGGEAGDCGGEAYLLREADGDEYGGGVGVVAFGEEGGGEKRRGAGQVMAAGDHEVEAVDCFGIFRGDIVGAGGSLGIGCLRGDVVAPQRPSWNFRKEDGGGMIIDMLCHWRYLVDNVFGNVKAISCLGATHVKERWDEGGEEV